MASIVLVPAAALVCGAALASFTSATLPCPAGVLGLTASAALVLYWCNAGRALLVVATIGCGAATLALAGDARDAALETSLRQVLDEAFGGFRLDGSGPEGRHEPVPVRARLTEDASPRGDYVSLRADVYAVRLHGSWVDAHGAVALSVSGVPIADQVDAWRAGRRVEAPVTFRRPARYLNDGVPDQERALALGGTTLFGSIKSGLLVEITARGSRREELAADVRAYVRRGAARWIAPHGDLSAAVVVAILIGDRTGLPPEIRERLQAAGTYHVIAISGGNIAILAGLLVGCLALLGLRGRRAAVLVMAGLAGYGQVVVAEPSVWRATLMGLLYFAARAADHRTSPWHAIGVAAAAMAIVRPLDVRSPGFILSFGATLALLEGGRRGRHLQRRHPAVAWITASLVASLATELVLLPVAASAFSRVTAAGLVLNLLAVPLMTVIQMAGMVATLLQPLESLAMLAGRVAHAAAWLLVESARLVEVAPWLSARVPPPPAAIVLAYYLAGLLALAGGRVRGVGCVSLCVCVLAIVIGPPQPRLPGQVGGRGELTVTVFDVGQAEAVLVQPPRGPALLVDAAGAPFGGAGADIGTRVLAPALWARGVRRLDALLMTHGHPDHHGGAAAVLRDFRPRALWHGVPVPSDLVTAELLAAAARRGAAVEERRAGERWTLGGVHVRVLHPPPPDWERREVRNDDSVVLELVFRDVAILLTGDIGAGVERALLSQLTPAPRRILKVAHHGSRTSTSQELLEHWRPQIAIISAGRGNSFNHPAPEVLTRLAQAGTTVLRTDRHGQITLGTDGRDVRVRTFADARR